MRCSLSPLQCSGFARGFGLRILNNSYLIPSFPLKSSCRAISKAAAHVLESDDLLRPSSLPDSPKPPQELVFQLLSILRSCHDAFDLHRGRQVHAQIIINGICDELLCSRLLGMYVLCRSFPDAKDVFFRLGKAALSLSPPLPWNWMIRGFTTVGWFDLALLFYFKLWFAGAVPDKYTFPYVIKACSGVSAVGLGRLIHRTIFLMDLETDMYIGSSLIKMYTEADDIEEAQKVFDRMPERDCVTWNVMIDGYARLRDATKAIQLFDTMRKANAELNYVSFACLLSVCASEGLWNHGIQLHGLSVKFGLDLEMSVANTLLSMYSKSRSLVNVQKLFDSMPQTDLVAWNGMISGYVQNSMKTEALEVFYEMQAAGVKPDSVTFTSFLPAFSDSTGLQQAKQIHSYILRHAVSIDAFLKSALIDIYFKCKDSRSAQKVYDTMGPNDVVICSAMISGYVLNGMSKNALEVFRSLLDSQLKPNPITLASVLPACSCLAALELGKELHCYILKKAYEGRCYVASALMDMYTKCGRLDIGYKIFATMSTRDVIAWNSMIASFAQNAQPEEAINLFRQMGMEGMKYDSVSISSVLSACANSLALHYGKEIYGFMARGFFKSDLFAEIDMYAKCGNLDLARRVFDLMHEKNEVSWNSIIAAYGAYGLVKDAMSLFRQMLGAGFLPDHITFLALISACAHTGQVEEGFSYFSCMHEEYGIEPRLEHYACMVDLYGRAGLLDKALDFIKSMPFKADAGIWGAVLGACHLHGNAELADIASSELLQLDPQNSGYYIIMSNISAVSGRWHGVSRARSLMRKRKVQKIPGCSWIDINNIKHVFVAADENHPESKDIYFFLKFLLLILKEEGYVPKPDLHYPVNTDFLR